LLYFVKYSLVKMGGSLLNNVDELVWLDKEWYKPMKLMNFVGIISSFKSGSNSIYLLKSE